MLKVTIQTKSKGDASKFLSRVKRALLGPKQVKVGFLGGDLAEIAGYNEFGTSRGIPERPFMRNSLKDNAGKYKAFTKSAARRIVMGDADMQAELNKLGLLAVGDIQDSINSNIPPANAPSTVKQKGSSKTLIDTGAMRQGVTHELE